MKITNKNSFQEVRDSINSALDEIKNKDYKLYLYLKNNIVMNEHEQTFCYTGKEVKINEVKDDVVKYSIRAPRATNSGTMVKLPPNCS